MKRVLVWGASPVAGWLAGRLHQAGHPVTWLADDAITATMYRFERLELVSPIHRMFVYGLRVSADIEAALEPLPDWIIFAMPNWAVGDAVMALSWRIPPRKCPPILLLVNGIGSLDKITTFYDAGRVLQAVYTPRFTWPMVDEAVPAYETIVSDALGGAGVMVHPYGPEAARLLETAFLASTVIRPQEPLLWSGLLWELQANALPALLDIAPEDVYRDPRLFAIEHRQLREAVAILDTRRIPLLRLPGVAVPRLAWQIRLLPQRRLASILAPNARLPSLRQALVHQAGRSDAAYLNGIVAAAAFEKGLGAPVNHVLALSVTDVAEGRARWSQFRDNPEYLETLIRVAARHA
ncbi:MAG: hypothetical protein GYB66_15755 [Chloroflexi bacterium]|nr:hypothetical protein [Chloroflexota bacterium]